MPSAITVALYFLIMGKFIGSRIGSIDGYSYIEFIAPGLIMMGIISNSYANSVSSFFHSKFQRHIEEMLVSPMPNYIIILGFVLGGMARGLVVGVAVTVTALFFTRLQIQSVTLVMITSILTAALFSTAGLINGIFAKNFDDTSIVPTFILTPLTYLGGIFFSIKMLPEFWYKVSQANPNPLHGQQLQDGHIGCFRRKSHRSHVSDGRAFSSALLNIPVSFEQRNWNSQLVERITEEFRKEQRLPDQDRDSLIRLVLETPYAPRQSTLILIPYFGRMVVAACGSTICPGARDRSYLCAINATTSLLCMMAI